MYNPINNTWKEWQLPGNSPQPYAKICRMITIKQFANNSPGFDIPFRPFFRDE